MNILKPLGLILVFIFCLFIIGKPHYIIANFYDVNINVALLTMFWYGGWYFGDEK